MSISDTTVQNQTNNVKAVLFDLDDTLFDHRHSSRSGLAAIQKEYKCFQQRPLDEIERDYIELLNESHPKVLQGVLSLQEARLERFQRLFSLFGEDVSPAIAQASVECYQQAYQTDRRPVPGAMPLLRTLKPMVKIAIVTNNLVTEQTEKLQFCGLLPFIDCLVVSEEVGFSKPEPAIFEVTLTRLQCRAKEAVMVGDSWEVDILGAHEVGIRAVWLNRYGTPCPDPALASEIRSLEPLHSVLELILADSWAKEKSKGSRGTEG